MEYQEQKDRMERLFRKINPSSGYHGNQKDYVDNLWYFFQTAWHLKDWIKADSSLQTFDLEAIVNNVRSLRICADLANRSKHLKLTKIVRDDAKSAGNDVTVHMQLGRISLKDLREGKIPIIKAEGAFYNYYITDKSGSKYPAIELAKQIIEDWEEIINQHVRLKDQNN